MMERRTSADEIALLLKTCILTMILKKETATLIADIAAVIVLFSTKFTIFTTAMCLSKIMHNQKTFNSCILSANRVFRNYEVLFDIINC